MNYKIAQLSLTATHKSSTTSEIFIAQPDAVKENLAGKLFIMIEIGTNGAETLKLINYLIDSLNYNFYQSEKIILRERVPSLKVEHIFEAALAKTNKNLLDFCENERIKINLSQVNLTAGVIHENMLYFSNRGRNKVFLIYKQKAESTGNRKNIKKPVTEIPGSVYRIIDIADRSKSNDNKPMDVKNFFHDVISGRVPEKSSFIITNEAMPEYISEKQLIEIVNGLPPISAAEQIKNTLSKINSFVSFIAIIIKSTTSERIEEARAVTASPVQSSITNLNRTEEVTEELLAPSGLINLKKWIMIPVDFVANKFRGSNSGMKLAIKDKIFFKKKSLAIIRVLYSFLKSSYIYIANFFFYIYKLLTNKDKLKNATIDLKEKSATAVDNSVSFLNALNKKAKALLIIAILALILFGINLTIINYKNKQEETAKKYNELASSIQQKQDQAEANLLYSNEEGAKMLFDEINALLTTMPQETDAQKQKYSEFADKMNQQLEKFRRITKISEPEIVANLVNLNSAADPQEIIFTSEKNKIYTSDQKDKQIYSLDAATKLVTALTGVTADILKLPAIGKNGLIYFFGGNKIIELDTANDSMKYLNINTGIKPEDVVASEIYNNNLYLVSAKDNKIIRFEKSGSSYSSGISWLKENADLSSATDIAIDGQIYILNKNGEVKRFNKGKSDDFKLDIVEPTITNATKIVALPDSNYLYILDSLSKRIVVFEKTGQFVMQYQFDGMDNIKDFQVDEKNKIIYILNSTVVYKTPAIHIK